MIMSRINGYVNEDGDFRHRIEFNTKSTWEMIQLNEICRDPNTDATHESYDNERVVVTVRPGW